MSARRDPRRTLVLRLRRAVRVWSRFDCAPDPTDPLAEVQTCRTCGHVERITHPTTPAMAKKLIAYRAAGTGVRGVCPGCSKKEAEARYPLETTP